jgi:hypothetical protein
VLSRFVSLHLLKVPLKALEIVIFGDPQNTCVMEKVIVKDFANN